MNKVIRVSFTKDEEQLFNDILKECKYIGQAKWMKIAAREKLQRDREKNNNTSKAISNNNNKLPIIKDLSEIFKGS